MVKRTDTIPGDTEIKAHQAARLRRLRLLMEPIQARAAELAGMTPSRWNRMEKGTYELDAIALARFCAGHDIGADYVITGRLGTLPDDLARLVALREHDEMQAAKAGAGGPADILALLAAETADTTVEPRMNGKARHKMSLLSGQPHDT